MKKNKTRIVQLGVVGVDSGQLVICDPSYIESEFKTPENDDADFGHDIYKDKENGSMWQFTYGADPKVERVNKFPGTYETVVPAYGETPNQLIKTGVWEKTTFDARPHIPDNEFSYRGVCKTTGDNSNKGGQLNYKLGHEGVAVAFSTGFGDGVYPVFAELTTFPEWGERISKIWIEFTNEENIARMKAVIAKETKTT